MDRGCFRTSVMHRNAHQEVVRACFGVLDEYIKIPVIVEYSGIEQLEFRLVLPPATILLHQPRIRKCTMGVLVEHFQIRMRGGGIQIIIQLFHVLSVIALSIYEYE